jgi:hypothetical protein
MTATSSSRAPLQPHNKSASFSAGIPQTKHIMRGTRPATAGATETSFLRIGDMSETHHQEVDNDNNIMTYLQSDFGDLNVIPTVSLELSSTPPSLNTLHSKQTGSDLNSLPPVFTRSESSVSLDGIGRSSTSSVPEATGPGSVGPATTSAFYDVQQRRLPNITYGKDGMVAKGSLLSLVGRLIVDSSGKKSKNVSDSYKSHL